MPYFDAGNKISDPDIILGVFETALFIGWGCGETVVFGHDVSFLRKTADKSSGLP
jgi:hypothetical protein